MREPTQLVASVAANRQGMEPLSGPGADTPAGIAPRSTPVGLYHRAVNLL